MSAIQQVMAALGAAAAAPGQQVFTSSGTFTVPAGVTSICAVAVGRGQNGAAGDGMGTPGGRGGEGGTLSYTNALSVTPGESLTVTIATSTSGSTGETTLKRSSTVLLAARAGGQTSGQANVGTSFAGGAAPAPIGSYGSGGGGAGGYSGAGGAGGSIGGGGSSGSGGSGGGGGSAAAAASGGGGGVGLLGAGSNGAAGSAGGGGGGGGSGGGAGNSGGADGAGGNYGGGGGGGDIINAGGSGGGGAVRIIWGAGRSYPSTNTADV